MSKIVIKRLDERAYKLRKFGVYIDNKKIGTINSGMTEEFHIDAGQHTVSIKIDFIGSPAVEFYIDGNEVKTYQVGYTKMKKWSYIIPPIIIILFAFSD